MANKTYRLIGISLDSAYLLEESGGAEKTYRIDSADLREKMNRIQMEWGRLCKKLNASPGSATAGELKQTLETHLMYRPKETKNLTETEKRFGLRQARYVPLDFHFPSVDRALQVLYRFWTQVMKDPEQIAGMVSLERKVQEGAEKEIDKWFKDIMNPIKA